MTAVCFGYLVENPLDGIDWSQIDGSLLPQLYRLGPPDDGSGRGWIAEVPFRVPS